MTFRNYIKKSKSENIDLSKFSNKNLQILSDICFNNDFDSVIMKSKVYSLLPFIEEEVADRLLKAGEGSRGGKVIGHTSSGKPIYSNFNNSNHANFTKQDHKDAANVHHNLRLDEDLDEDTSENRKERHKHFVQASNHERATKNLK